MRAERQDRCLINNSIFSKLKKNPGNPEKGILVMIESAQGGKG